MRRILTFYFYCSVFIFCVNGVFAQNSELSQSDLSQVKIDNYSDSQIEALIKRAEQQGYSVDQFETLAAAKGMPASEISKLKARIEKIQSSGNTKSDSDKFQDRSRTYTNPEENTTKNSIDLKKNIEEKDVKGDIFGLFTERHNERPEDKLFGFSLFNRKKLNFEPSLNIATPQNYQLGANDEIIIDIWGASQETYKEKITPDGTIFINNIGIISLNGFTIEDATAKIRKALSKIYSGLLNGSTFIKVSLGNVRSIKVNIVGDVYLPGTYTLPSLASAFNALYAAGGPSMNGSLRNVKVIRDNKTIADLDFYNFLLKGEIKDNVRLQDQDVIFVPSYQNRIELNGEVKRPFYYDMLAHETLSDLIKFSGGFTGNAYNKRIKIIRKTGIEQKILDVAVNNSDTLHLSNGDEVSIDSVINRFENRVIIKGAVYRPGNFSIDSSLTLKQLIKKAEGLRGDAFLNRVSIYRMRDDYTMEVIPVDLNSLLTNTNDIELKREDMVVISSIYDIKEEYNIKVEGEVRLPGEYLYVANSTIEDLIIRAGGLKESASLARIEVARRVKNATAETTSNHIAELFQFQITEDLKLTNSARQFILQPFDQVFIRRSPGYEIQNIVALEGELLFPGKYTLSNKNERISSLINRAGGLTPEAFPKGARLLRKLPVDAKARQKALETIRSQNRDSVKFIIELDSVSTIGINLDRILANPGSKYDIILQEGDIVKVPKELQTVRLSGQVLSPVLVRYDHAFGFRKYISSAGGFAPDAKKGKSYIIYANGTLDRTHKFIFFNVFPKVEAGAEIVVPKKAERKGMSAGETIALGTAVSSLALIIVTIINATK
jgi:protein involved in polysaccharide export with SLBB domain